MAGFPASYDSDKVEKKWREKWKQMQLYRFDRESDAETFAIDTPPPYVSGDLHVGHAMSYNQAEFIARFKRMQGYNVFYPMGFDDNGLPTERYVERTLDIDKQEMGRRAFIEKCKEVTSEGRQNYQEIWDMMGISVDWSLQYTTIDERSQRVSQLSFIDLFQKDKMYRNQDPVIWCPECRTGIAQADLEDDEQHTHLNDITFQYVDSDGGLTISTTRPELIPACVAVFVHPDDERYTDLLGEEVEVPLTGKTVEIMADHKVDPEFGSGAVMVCTFGDKTDIEWWKDHGLDRRVILNEDGTLNEKAGDYAGMSAEEAREAIIDDLDDEGLLEDQEALEHAVQVHERCDTPVEYLMAEQWFVSMLDAKDELIERGNDVEWFPEFMHDRFDEWTEGLKWDWCVSRQRFYGVSFPVWYCEECDEPVLADAEDLPVDPTEDEPPSDACPACGNEAFEPETDVMDTWFTSSLTPLINARWKSEGERMDIYPLDLRPQGYDIIRTWAFYTVLKSHFHTDSRPWDDIMVSGMAMAEEGVSFSKSKGIVVKPRNVVDKYSADALRWWSSKVKLGEDLVYREDDLKAGEKLVTKLWNIARFLDQFIDKKPERPDGFSVLDRWLLAKLDETIERATDEFERYEYDQSKERAKEFAWHDLADDYLEIVKQELYEDDEPSSLSVLYHSFLSVIKLLAPIMPFATEEIFNRLYREFEEEQSIHVSSWPEPTGEGSEEVYERGETVVAAVTALRKYKSDKNMSLNEQIAKAELFGVAEDDEIVGAVERAMKVEKVVCRPETPEITEEIEAVSLDYSEVGPKFGSRVKDIEAAVEEGRFTIDSGLLRVDLADDEVDLTIREDVELEKRYTLEGRDGTLVQTDDIVILVER